MTCNWDWPLVGGPCTNGTAWKNTYHGRWPPPELKPLVPLEFQTLKPMTDKVFRALPISIKYGEPIIYPPPTVMYGLFEGLEIESTSGYFDILESNAEFRARIAYVTGIDLRSLEQLETEDLDHLADRHGLKRRTIKG